MFIAATDSTDCDPFNSFRSGVQIDCNSVSYALWVGEMKVIWYTTTHNNTQWLYFFVSDYFETSDILNWAFNSLRSSGRHSSRKLHDQKSERNTYFPLLPSLFVARSRLPARIFDHATRIFVAAARMLVHSACSLYVSAKIITICHCQTGLTLRCNISHREKSSVL